MTSMRSGTSSSGTAGTAGGATSRAPGTSGAAAGSGTAGTPSTADPAPGGLSVRGLAVTYGGRPAVSAVSGLDLDVAPGEVVALLGPSGCGKSSLLRAVAGLEDLAAGEVRWDGEDVAGLPVHRRGFGLMFQDGQLFEHRDVTGNVAYGLRRLPRGQRARRVEEMLALVGLSGLERRRVATLSGGQAQRVALARSLAPSPRLLLLDEPLSSLDRALRDQLAVDLRTILRAQGTTALYVTHDQDEAMTVADRVGVMGAGRLLRLDTPERLWAHPGSGEVARFLGFGPFLAAGEGAGACLALAPGALWAQEPGEALRVSPGTSPGRAGRVGAGEPVATGRAGEETGPPGLGAQPPTKPSARLVGTALGSRVRRGRWEVEVVLGPGQVVTLGGSRFVTTGRERVAVVARAASQPGETVTALLDLARTALLPRCAGGGEPAS
ncbi:ABC transporter ATP-binding protein [Actinomyces wuliandei]|uniref:ABC transporter ATP-binding protein n=1 Tax=Actinomyces wuliandei TaxID=2057743 RepID=UPI001FAA6D7A|nr:ABC transporter ATP-binding protein [Actinomyces wuliandei]